MDPEFTIVEPTTSTGVAIAGPAALLDGPLMQSEQLIAEMESCLLTEDWEGLARLATSLRGALQQLDFGLLSQGGGQPPEVLESLAGRLGDVGRRHSELILVLTAARDHAAAELAATIEGHRGANHYLLAAGGA